MVERKRGRQAIQASFAIRSIQQEIS